jgi:hypothetical protein
MISKGKQKKLGETPVQVPLSGPRTSHESYKGLNPRLQGEKTASWKETDTLIQI